MIVTRYNEAPIAPAPPPSKKYSKLMIDPVMGSQHLAVGIAVYPPGEKGKPHAHTGEETIIIYKGKAKITNLSSDKKEEYILEPLDLVYVKPGELHTIENVGNEDLVFIWIYTPPGDEKEVRARIKTQSKNPT